MVNVIQVQPVDEIRTKGTIVHFNRVHSIFSRKNRSLVWNCIRKPLVSALRAFVGE